MNFFPVEYLFWCSGAVIPFVLWIDCSLGFYLVVLTNALSLIYQFDENQLCHALCYWADGSFYFGLYCHYSYSLGSI